MPEIERQTLHCDCCPPGKGEGMAYQEGHRLIIVRSSHSKRHILILPLDSDSKLRLESKQGKT